MSAAIPAGRLPEETLDDLYDSAPCGYLTLDLAGHIVRANTTLRRWLGLSADALLSKRVQDILTPAGRIFFETHVAPVLITAGAVGQVSIDLKCADATRLPVLTDWRQVIVDGRAAGVRVMLVNASDRRAYERDLVAARERAQEVARQLRASELRLLEANETLEAKVLERTAALEEAHEQLRQSQKLEAMGTLTGGVAHDFNNLLTPIIGGLDMLERRGVGDERMRRVIAGALASAERAKTLVQRLLAFARRQPLLPAPVDMVQLVRGMADLIDSTCGPQIRIVFDAAEGLPHAMADANQMEMALLNLAVNARDAMPDGGTLTIGVALGASCPVDGEDAPQEPFLTLSVADTGSGMDDDTLARAIEPFFSTKGVGRGTGLGLSMVHGLAAQLGGRLQIESRLGSGTRIDFMLLLAAAIPAGHQGENDDGAGSKQGMVLLVDDEDLIRATTTDMLTDIGYRVVEASSAAEALKLIDEGFTPDLLVTDHLMPGMTGTELARTLLARWAIPVLIVSGYAEVESIAPDLARLAKPFRQADLAEALTRAAHHEP